MIIDATNLILGRLCSFAAKKSLLGEKIDIINSENAVVIGKREDILEKYKEKRRRGHPYKGPFFPTLPGLILKRTIRGMLPYKQYKGEIAFKNVKCYDGVPIIFKDKKVEDLKMFKIKEKHMRCLTLKEISKQLRG